MKRTIAGILVILAVIAFFCLIACGVSNTTTTQATVTAIEGDEVTLTDINGEMWVWIGTEDYTVNEEVVITFDTMGNDNLYDDVIISIEQLTE